jgi:DNA-binding NarL/FixJ family response regulator
LLADDFRGLLVAWRRLLQQSCEVIDTVSSGREAVEAATKLRPDVIVLDVSMSDLNGLDACRQIKRAVPETKVIIVTAVDDPDVRRAAFQVGASAFVSKQSAVGELEQAIRWIFTEK